MQPIGPFVVCYWRRGDARPLSAVRWLYGGCLWPSDQDYRAREASAKFSRLAACKTLASCKKIKLTQPLRWLGGASRPTESLPAAQSATTASRALPASVPDLAARAGHGFKCETHRC